MTALWGRGWGWRVFVTVVALSTTFLLGLITSMLASDRDFGSAVGALATIVGLGVAGLLAGVQLAAAQKEATGAAAHAASLAVLDRRFTHWTEAGAGLIDAVDQYVDASKNGVWDYVRDLIRRRYSIEEDGGALPFDAGLSPTSWSDYRDKIEIEWDDASAVTNRRLSKWELVGGGTDVRGVVATMEIAQFNYIGRADSELDPNAIQKYTGKRDASEMGESFIDALHDAKEEFLRSAEGVRRRIHEHLRRLEAELEGLREARTVDPRAVDDRPTVNR